MPAMAGRRCPCTIGLRALQPQTAAALGALVPPGLIGASLASRSVAPRKQPQQRERPQAPWHPLPLSEIVILAGAAAVVFGVIDGPSRAAPALLIGIGAVAVGTGEVSWREHFSGYRSHALLLALIPVVALHTAIVLGVNAFATFPRAANVALVAVDLVLVFALFRYLRARYVEARTRTA